MGLFDFGKKPEHHSIFGGSTSSDYDDNGHYNPGKWREEYDKENWEYHKTVCDHDDPWDCNDDDHF